EKKQQQDTDARSVAEETKDEDAAPSRPVIPSGIEEQFVDCKTRPDNNGKLVYRPGILGNATLHFIKSTADVDRWRDVSLLVRCGNDVPDPIWDDAQTLDKPLETSDMPQDDFVFYELPDAMRSKKSYSAWEKALKDHMYRHQTLTVYKQPELKEYAPVGSTQGEARVHFRQSIRELRDLQQEKLRAKYATKMHSIEKKIRSAQDRVSREKDQYNSARLNAILSFGGSLLGAFMGNKVASRTNVSKATTAMRGAGRAVQQHGDVTRAQQAVIDLEFEREELENELQEELNGLAEKYDLETLELEEQVLTPRKSDLKTQDPIIVWLPWQIDQHGMATPLF
ncbi:MAG: ATP-binding protein, partial [Planctomycetota bacterium]